MDTRTQSTNRILSPATRPRVVVALADWTERDRLTLVIEHARPQYELLQVPPDGVDMIVPAFKPDVVICSDTSATIEAHVSTILVLNVQPHGAPRAAVLCRNGVPQIIKGLSIAEILELLDEQLQQQTSA